MKSALLVASFMVGGLLFAPATQASSTGTHICSGQGLSCLFVDAAGCAITCGPGECCHVKGARCILGFGSSAVCTCRPCPGVIVGVAVGD